MKKVIALFALFAVVALAGCQTASTSTDPTVPEGTLAGACGTLAAGSLSIDNSVMGVIGLSVPASEVRMSAPSTPEVDGDWWTSTNNWTYGGTTYTISYNFRLVNSSGTVCNTQALLDGLTAGTLDDVWMYVSWGISSSTSSLTLTYGNSKDDPLKVEGLINTPKTISGPVSISGSEDGTAYSMTLTYGELALGTSGYPTGTVTVTFKEGSSTVAEATIVFNNTDTATITFTSGYSGSYTVDLDTGIVTASL